MDNSEHMIPLNIRSINSIDNGILNQLHVVENVSVETDPEIFDELNTPSTSGQILVEAPAIILPKQIVPIPKAKRENKVKRRKSKKSEVRFYTNTGK